MKHDIKAKGLERTPLFKFRTWIGIFGAFISVLVFFNLESILDLQTAAPPRVINLLEVEEDFDDVLISKERSERFDAVSDSSSFNDSNYSLTSPSVCIVGNAETFQRARQVFNMWEGKFPACWFIWGKDNLNLPPRGPRRLMYVRSGEKSSWSQGIEAAVSELKATYDCDYVFTHDDDLIFQTVPSHLPNPNMSLPEILLYVLRTYKPAMAAFAWDEGDHTYRAMRVVKKAYQGKFVAPLTGFDNGNVIYHKSVLPFFIPFSPRGERGFIGRWTLGAHFLQFFGPMIFSSNAIRIQGLSYKNTINPDNQKSENKVKLKDNMAFYNQGTRHPYEYPMNEGYIRFLEEGLLDPDFRWGRDLLPSDVEPPAPDKGLDWYSAEWIVERLGKYYNLTHPAISSNTYIKSTLSHRDSFAPSLGSSPVFGDDQSSKDIGIDRDAGIRFRIQIFTQSRFDAFQSLWISINKARRISKPVEIFIHIDGVEGLSQKEREAREVDIADIGKLHSPHGNVSVVVQSEQLGLRKSIMRAWAASDDREFCIFLEDDLQVSEYFLEFADRMASAYFDSHGVPIHEKLIGISLYNNEYSEVLEADVAVENGNKQYLYQMPQSWGSVYTASAWRNFVAYYNTFDPELDPLIPDSYANRWPHSTSWKKYLMRYMYETGSYLVYPNLADGLSYSTNSMKTGAHHQESSSEQGKKMKDRFKVPLLKWFSSPEQKALSSPPFQELHVYDLYHKRVANVSSLTNVKPVKAIDGCTLVLVMYSRVDEFIRRINYYATSPYLSRILVVWNNLDIQPPEIPSNLTEKVRVLRMEKNSLHNRYFPWPEIETDCVVNMDDDWELDLGKMNLAIRAWKGLAGNFIVGFSFLARNHVQSETGTYYYAPTNLEHSPYKPRKSFFSILLPSGTVYHKRFSHLYTYGAPKEARDFVHKNMNCEDILFNFLVANATNQGPVVISHWQHSGRTDGLWTRGTHLSQRSECLQKFAGLFGHMPLRYSLETFKPDIDAGYKGGRLPGLQDAIFATEIPYDCDCNEARFEKEQVCDLECQVDAASLGQSDRSDEILARFDPAKQGSDAAAVT